MKRRICIILIVFLFLFQGCSSGKKQNDDKNKMEVKNDQKIDITAAKSFMDNYMKYLLKKNTSAVKSFYTVKLKESLKDVPLEKEPHAVGYKIEKGEMKEKKIEYTAHIYNAYSYRPYFSDDMFKYTIVLEDGNMKIESISKEKSVEIYEKNGAVIKKDDKGKEESLLGLSDLPEFITSEESNLLEQKFEVPKGKLGPLAMSPDGKTYIITSMDKNTFICTVKKEEEKQTFTEGGAEDKQKPGGGGKKKGTEKEKPEEEGKKKTITIKPVDFYFECKVNIICFSNLGKFFAVEYVPKSSINHIFIYDSNGKKVKTEIENRFPVDKFYITSPVFTSNEEICFSLKAIESATDEEKKLNGEWVYNLKTKKLSQVTG